MLLSGLPSQGVVSGVLHGSRDCSLLRKLPQEGRLGKKEISRMAVAGFGIIPLPSKDSYVKAFGPKDPIAEGFWALLMPRDDQTTTDEPHRSWGFRVWGSVAFIF